MEMYMITTLDSLFLIVPAVTLDSIIEIVRINDKFMKDWMEMLTLVLITQNQTVTSSSTSIVLLLIVNQRQSLILN